MKKKVSQTNVMPEACAELDSVSGACGADYQASHPNITGEIADIPFRFTTRNSAMTTVVN